MTSTAPIVKIIEEPVLGTQLKPIPIEPIKACYRLRYSQVQETALKLLYGGG